MLAGIQPHQGEANACLQQLVSDKNLDAALAWLQQQDAEQDHSNVWADSQYWIRYKARLQQQLESATFCFQSVREVQTADEMGQSSQREIRVAEDRLLIRAIAQILQPIIAANLVSECSYLVDNGGTKAAHDQVQAYMQQHPHHQVIKSDVKGYYAHIDHSIVQQQFEQLLPNEPLLSGLLWQFMRRTVEHGGHYRNVARGLPLETSLSPLLGVLYFSPLDQLASQTPHSFYRRYRDEWIWVLPKKTTLRKALKQQDAVLHALHMVTNPERTFIGKVSNSFDLLDFKCSPTMVTVCNAVLSPREHRVAQLDGQGAPKQRIWAYRLRWLVCVGAVGALGLASATETPSHVAVNCEASSNATSFNWKLPTFFGGFDGAFNMELPASGSIDGLYNTRVCNTATSSCANTVNPRESFQSLYFIDVTSDGTGLTCTGPDLGLLNSQQPTFAEPITHDGTYTMTLSAGASTSGTCYYTYSLVVENNGTTFKRSDFRKLDAPPAKSVDLCTATTQQSTYTYTDGPPIIINRGHFDVAEGSEFVAKIDAVDFTRDTMRYHLMADAEENALFTLDETSGELRFKQAPDYENPHDANRDNVYSVTVAASDNSHTTTKTFEVRVSDLSGETDTITNEPPSSYISDLGSATESTLSSADLVKRECSIGTESITAQYVAFFNRAPDAAGLHYWAKESGLTLEQVGASFFNQAETQAAYPPETSNREFVTRVYSNLFGRVPDDEGLNYWVGELDSGRIYREQTILAFINGAQANDKALLDNKTAVGCYFAAKNPTGNAKLAQQVMQNVTADKESFNQQREWLGQFE